MKEMTCREFDEAVHGFVRMELLDVNLREAVLEHAAHCALCADRMIGATALVDTTEIAGRNVQAQETPSHVEAVVLAAFRSHHRRASWLRTFEWVTVGAAAAVLVLFLWNSAGRSKGPLQPTPKRNVSSASQQPLDAKVVSSSPQSDQVGLPQDAEIEIADTSTSDAYVPSDFVPVPFTTGVSMDDPGMVVRVQLTRSSLEQLGYPIAETPDQDLIPADVLVDEDGWPRAVKLAVQ